MAETHDTIKGLLAEFRGYAAGMPDSYHVTMSWADFRKMLTRFEWAHDHDIATATEASARTVVGACVKQREAERERDEMLDALVRIGNWCAQDLGENAYVSDSSGNYLKTLNGLCEVCRPFMQKASRLKRYGGAGK